MNKRHTSKVGKHVGIACLLFVCAAVLSCRDEYIYDDLDKVPEWLGESIYEELQDGLRDNESPEGWSFKYFLQVIDDCNYKDVLMKTGSKTLFVADDSAFLVGIKERWGIERYEDLQPGHKRTILYSAMLDNAYLLEMMSSTPASGMGDPNAGECLRRFTSANVLDTIYSFSGSQLPQNNSHWDEFRDAEVRMALDNTEPMMVHFLTEQLKKVGITNNDLSYLVSRPDASVEKAYVFNKEVIKRDVTCKNGYINLLDGLLIPPSNMAEEIRKDSTLSLYSRILDRFAVPVYNETLSNQYNENQRQKNPNAPVERVYEKRYFTRSSNRASFGAGFLTYKDYDGNNHTTTEEAALDFSPGWNEYRSEQFAKDVDMAAMFVPTNEALMAYFSPGGAGAPLIDRYGNGAPLPQAIDSIDLKVISELVRNMMEPSFNQSVPSKFGSLKDDANDDKGVKEDHLYGPRPCIIANNGVVYLTTAVYSPAVYVSVSAPAKLNKDMEAMYKIIEKEDYNSYLLAMQSEFSFINPVNDALVYYDPTTSYTTTPVGNASQNPIYYKIIYDSKEELLSYASGNHNIAKDSLEKATAKNLSESLIKNIHREILEHAIVVGNIADGNNYHQTKGYATIKVNFEEQINEEGILDTVITHIWGGRELEYQLAGKRDNGIPVTRTFTQENGKTYRLEEGLIHPATRSVYNVLKTTEEFKHFFALCAPDSCELIINSLREVKADGYTFKDNASAEVANYKVFTRETGAEGLDYNVNSFSTYHYTVYVPDSNAIVDAIINDGLPQWYELKPLSNAIDANRTKIGLFNDSLKETNISDVRKDSLTRKRDVLIAINDSLRDVLREPVSLIANFVKYHMQDNSIYVDNHPVADNGYYVTASKNDANNRFDELLITSGSRSLQIQDGNGDLRYVVKAHDMENILYNVMARDIEKKNGGVNTSSYAVIHQIDGCLSNSRFEQQMEDYRNNYRNNSN